MDKKLLAQLAKLLYEYERGHPFPEHYGSLLHIYVCRAEIWLDGGRSGGVGFAAEAPSERWSRITTHPGGAERD